MNNDFVLTDEMFAQLIKGLNELNPEFYSKKDKEDYEEIRTHNGYYVEIKIKKKR